MNDKKTIFFDFLKKYSKKKRSWVILGVVIILLVYFLKPVDNSKNILTDIAKYVDLKQTVLSTGQVTSKTDLNLSFNSSGIIKSLKVKVGDKVKSGQILATIDQGSAFASLTQARGSLAAAKARLQKILDGASNEEITLAQVSLDQTKMTQDILVKNAYQNLLNSNLEAVPKDTTKDYEAPVISGTYNLGKEGIINLNYYSSTGGTSFTVSGLTNGSGLSNSIIAQPIGNSGLYIKFPFTTNINLSDWIIDIPNKKAANYLTNYNAYQVALSQAKSAIDQRTAELALKKAQARTSDVDLAKADIITAEGQTQGAQSKYEDTILRAPSDGTITRVDIKPGELASALKEVVVLQDVSNIYLETNINEANIASISIGTPVDINFDALGSNKTFKGKITEIDPSSTLVSGVVNYKVTASIEQVKDLRPGMTANMTINVKSKSHVIVVPSRAVIVAKDGTKTIRIITNTKTKKFKEVPITTGLEGDGGMVEVVNGLTESEEFVTLLKI